MRAVRDLLDALDRIAPFSKAAGWDPVGLQLGDPDAELGTVGVAHELTDEVVEAVVERSVDTVVVYHPLVFDGLRRVVAGPGVPGRVHRLVAAGRSVVVVHTSFDVARGGTADALAAALDLDAVRPFGPGWGAETVVVVTYVPDEFVDVVVEAMSRAGAGRIGAYEECSFRGPGTGTFRPGPGAAPTVGEVGRRNAEPEERLEMIAPASRRDEVVAALADAHPYEEPAYHTIAVDANAGFIGRVGVRPDIALGTFATAVAERLETEPRVAGDLERPVARIAVVPGAGRSFVDDAAAVADVLVTGDVSHHAARRALDRGLAVVDAGHIATERPGLRALYAAVGRIADDVVDLTDLDPGWKERRWRN